MSDNLPAEFEMLWTSAQTPPDVVQYLRSVAHQSANYVGAIVKLDQQYRWKTAAPMTVEDYLNAVPEWRNDRDLILELTAGEFLARLDVQHLPYVGEYAERFPHLESEVRQKLSGLSTNGAVNTSVSVSLRESLDRVFDIDDICDAFEQVWRESSTPPFIEAWVLHGRREERAGLLKELLRVELCVRVERKEAPTLQEYRQRFPSESPFRDILSDWEQHPQQYILSGVPSTKKVGPQEVGATIIGRSAVHSSQSGTLELDGSQRIGHFRLLKQLGRGTFGRVYRAHDEQLERAVAIKVPRRSSFRRPEDAEAYLVEARTVARLDHPGIVPVYQAGRSDDGSVYVVSRLIEGRSLEEVIKNQRPDFSTTAQLIASVARALHYAHQHRVIHRDIKPANILIDDATGTPFVADFGLAMKEEDYLKQAGVVAGTPSYMSPEQARAEGHRLDGRSDLFSLGIVLYEMLTGKRPFRGSTANETRHQVISVAPRPPRAIDETIPAELERICLKAISKRTSDRYATAELMAEDLEAWLKPAASPASERKTEVQVVPKGLRSFDANDADFFLDLLPGTRNRDGLPESIAFWKQRIEETAPEKTFNVGLIYGPSGCGKSSLVKAGLLPHLSKDVIAVYLEATPDETELRILRGLKKRVDILHLDNQPPGEPQGASRGLGTPASTPVANAIPLTETLLHLRRSSQQKVVIIIDQLEQWLHAHRSEPDAELVQALRQCDGVHLQAIVMIRDDFAMAAARFMQALDVAIVQGNNFATVDLFEVDHAKNVLIKFGQSFGKLPANSDNLSADEQQFVTDAANGLAQDGKVVSVRLSLFAEMIKTKRWTPETLQKVGGTQGIGVNFLEETFSSPQANPRHRLHAAAARAVLKSLLPDLGTDIKGHMRSQQELLKASGYMNRPTDFTDLLRILDGELRLITPTDPEGDSLSDSSRNSSFITRHYQLSHDYLVSSLRDWLTRKQRETRRGRAEVTLEDHAHSWSARRRSQSLPGPITLLTILCFTSQSKWKSVERTMIWAAIRHHTTRLLFLAIFVAVNLSLVSVAKTRMELGAAVELIRTSQSTELERLLNTAEEDATDLVPLLKPLFIPTGAPTTENLNLAVALTVIGSDPESSSYLASMIKEGQIPLHLTPALAKCLGRSPRKTELAEDLWSSIDDQSKHTLSMAAVLSEVEGNNSKWTHLRRLRLAKMLISQESLSFAGWTAALKTLIPSLLDELEKFYVDRKKLELSERQVDNATALLRTFAANDPQRLARLIVQAGPIQYRMLIPEMETHPNGPSLLKTAESYYLQHLNSDRQPSEDRDVPAVVTQQFQEWQGFIHTRFAYCQTAPLDHLLKVADQLRPYGYRPIKIRPFLHQQTLRATAIFRRDYVEWHVSKNLTPMTIDKEKETLYSKGFQPVDAAGYCSKSSVGAVDEYVAVWEQQQAKTEKEANCKLFVGLQVFELNQWRDELNENSDNPFSPMSLHCFRDHLGILRWSGILQRDSYGARWHWARSFSQQHEIDPDTWRYIELGVTDVRPHYFTKDLWARVRQHAESELKNDAESPRALAERAEASFHLGDFEAAAKDFERLSIIPDASALPLFRLCVCYARLGQAERVESAIDAAALASSSPTTRDYLGCLTRMYITGDIPNAVSEFECLLAANPNDAVWHYDGACLYSLASEFSKDSVESGVLLRRAEQCLATVISGRESDLDLLLHVVSDSDLDFLLRSTSELSIVPLKRYFLRSSTITKEDHEVEQFVLLDVSPQEVVARTMDVASQGYVPVTLSTWQQDGDGKMHSSVTFERPRLSAELIEREAQSRAMSRIALAQLGDIQPLLNSIGNDDDRRLQAWLIHWMAECDVTPDELVNELHQEISNSTKRSLILALGRYRLSDELMAQLKKTLIPLSESTVDSGIRSACRWTLRRLGSDLKMVARGEDGNSREANGWYQAVNGHEMLILRGPISFTGSAFDNRRFDITIPRDFSICSTEVTREQFAEFRAECAGVVAGVSTMKVSGEEAAAPALGCPQAGGVSWYVAAAYCRWLSEKANLPEEEMCYPPLNEIKPGMSIPANFLLRKGFRLPTAIEWEYAGRAKSRDSRSFGYSEQLLPEYGWYAANSEFRTWPVAQKLPNQFGFFDMLGNVKEWCQDCYREDVPTRDTYLRDWIRDSTHERPRLMFGGGYLSASVLVNADFGGFELPGNTATVHGFRVARTERFIESDENQTKGSNGESEYLGY